MFVKEAPVCYRLIIKTMKALRSKFDQNFECSGLECAQPIARKFCTLHDSVTVVTYAKYLYDEPNML